jgi:hypothetical protein
MGVKNLTEYRVGQWETLIAGAAELSRGLRRWREILGEDQAGLQGMVLAGKVVEQAAETDQIDPARAIGQERIFLAQAAEPAEQMGIAAQLRELEHLREIRLEIGEEAMGSHSIVSVGSRQSLDAGVKHLLEFLVGQSGGWGRSHKV